MSMGRYRGERGGGEQDKDEDKEERKGGERERQEEREKNLSFDSTTYFRVG